MSGSSGRRNRGSKPGGSVHPIGTPSGLSPNTGPLAAAAWLLARELTTHAPRWSVEITLRPFGSAAERGTQLRVEIFSEEWGFSFQHEGKASWIRVTDVPFVHGADDHRLLEENIALKNIGLVANAMEDRFGFVFDRERAELQTTLVAAESAIREWIASWPRSRTAALDDRGGTRRAPTEPPRA